MSMDAHTATSQAECCSLSTLQIPPGTLKPQYPVDLLICAPEWVLTPGTPTRVGPDSRDTDRTRLHFMWEQAPESITGIAVPSLSPGTRLHCTSICDSGSLWQDPPTVNISLRPRREALQPESLGSLRPTPTKAIGSHLAGPRSFGPRSLFQNPAMGGQ